MKKLYAGNACVHHSVEIGRETLLRHVAAYQVEPRLWMVLARWRLEGRSVKRARRAAQERA
jgi:hypothetical protein